MAKKEKEEKKSDVAEVKVNENLAETIKPINAADDGNKMAAVETVVSGLLDQVDEANAAVVSAKEAADLAGKENETLKESVEKLAAKAGVQSAKPGDYVVKATIKKTGGGYQQPGEKYTGEPALIASYMAGGAIEKVKG